MSSSWPATSMSKPVALIGPVRLSEGCDGIRSPSRAYPFSEMLHGRSLNHVAYELGLEQHSSVVRRVANCLTKKGEEPALALLYSKAVKRKLLAVDLEL